MRGDARKRCQNVIITGCAAVSDPFGFGTETPRDFHIFPPLKTGLNSSAARFSEKESKESLIAVVYHL